MKSRSSNSGQLPALEHQKQNVASMIAPSFLTGSMSNLQVTRTGINPRMNSISGQI